MCDTRLGPLGPRVRYTEHGRVGRSATRACITADTRVGIEGILPRVRHEDVIGLSCVCHAGPTSSRKKDRTRYGVAPIVGKNLPGQGHGGGHYVGRVLVRDTEVPTGRHRTERSEEGWGGRGEKTNLPVKRVVCGRKNSELSTWTHIFVKSTV